MHKNSKLLVAVAAVGLVAVGTTAFTDSNTLPANDSGAVGYGATTVTGITVTTVEYDVLATDTTKLQTVNFVSSDDGLSSSNGYLNVSDSSPMVIGSVDCGGPTGDDSTSYTYTCTFGAGDELALSAVETVGFSVTRDSVSP